MKKLSVAFTVVAALLASQKTVAADTTAPRDVVTPHAATAPALETSPSFLALVGDQVISAAAYESAANEAARQKFFHGKPPEGALDNLLREVANEQIDRLLLINEAKRRKLVADAAAVDARIARYEQRYAKSPRWLEQRDQILPGLRERLEQDNQLAALEAAVRKIPPPDDAAVRAYYKANPDKFTEPAKLKVSLILLRVSPSATTAVWKQAETEARALELRLREGADFAALAKQYSADESAARGGDLGYVHRGMLPDALQNTIENMKLGELSPPTRVLEGYAMIRYEALQEARHHDFDRVRQRASDLLARDRSDKAWADFRAALRKSARIVINTQRYPMLEGLATAAP